MQWMYIIAVTLKSYAPPCTHLPSPHIAWKAAMAPSATIDALTSALVARYLRSYDYSETLEAFIREAGLDPDVGQSPEDNNWTIQSLIEEKENYDQTVNFERYAEDNQQSALWSEPGGSQFFSLLGIGFKYPVVPAIIDATHDLTSLQHHPNPLLSKHRHQQTPSLYL
jgi:hypothetical protein